MKDNPGEEGLNLKRLLSFVKRLTGVSETSTTYQFYNRKDDSVGKTDSKNNMDRSNSTMEPQNGWQRIKAMYQDGEIHGEREACLFITKAAFLTGAFIGGFFNVNRTFERYNIYSEGRKFLSRTDAVLRSWDYAVVVFMKNGLKAGIKSAAVVGCVALLSSHLAVWRNHFSAWYFPMISVPLFAFLSLPYGSCALIEGTTMGISTGLSLTAGAYLIAFAKGDSVNETYNSLKYEYEEHIRKRKGRILQIKAIMKEENLWFPGDAAKILKERELRKPVTLEELDCTEGEGLSSVSTSVNSRKT